MRSKAIDGLRQTGTAMTAVLASYGSALVIERLAGLRVDIVVTAVVLAMTLARIQRSADGRDRLAGLLLLPVVAVLAWCTGWLISQYPDAGDALFVLAMAGSVWVRRFGARATRAGMLVVSPLIAVLIVGQGGAGQAGLGWVVLIALIAGGWVNAFALLAARAGFVRPEVRAMPPGRQAPGGRDSAKTGRRITASTRMALQLGVALAAAFAAGRAVWPEHWPWVVLTAYIVCSGAAGRGDVLFKGLLRVAGAAVGTLVAAGVAGTFGPRADMTVVLMFVALATATWLREFSYAYWAGIVTAVLSLLYGWFGESPDALLDTRLEGILLGAALGIGASWLILPVRTSDVLRRRSADAVAALGDVLGADRSDPAALRRGQVAFEHSAGRLAAIGQPLRAQRMLLGRWRAASGRGADAIDAIERSAEPVRLFVRAAGSTAGGGRVEEAAGPVAGDGRVSQAAEAVAGHDRVSEAVAAVHGNVIAIRRAIGRRPGKPYRPAVFASEADGDINDADDLSRALRQIDGALGALSIAFAGG